MGYNKIISYGDTLEIYEYEKNIVRLFPISRGDDEKTDVHLGMGTVREDSLSDQRRKEEGKRADNARRASLAFRRIVSANLGGPALPLMVTLTYADNFTDLAGAYKHLTTFIQALRRRFGKDFSYVLVPEFQKRGAVHFHALFWGLPKELFHRERKAREVRTLWGKGHVFLKETDGNEKIAFYLSKYFTKAFLDPRLKNQKSYVASRNIKRPLVQTGPFVIDYVLEQFGVIEAAIVDRTYNTKWLGQGRFRLFKFSHDES
jgi:hypothetical protein